VKYDTCGTCDIIFV